MRIGLYAPSRFAIPTASSQRLQAGGNNRGGGTILLGGVDGSVWALQGVSLKDEIDALRDEISEMAELARVAAGCGDTVTARTLANKATSAAARVQGLGNLPDSSTVSELEASGWDPGEIDTLVAMGASDEQLLALPYPASADEMGAAFSALMSQLTTTKQAVRVSPAPVPPSTQPAAAQQPSQPTAGVPAGSQITYTAQISASFNPLSASAQSLASTIAAVNSNLQSQWHIALLNWADKTPTLSVGVGNWTVTLNLQTLADYGSLSDVKSVVDGAFYNAARASVLSSSLSATSLAVPATRSIGTGLPGGVLPGGAANFTLWFEQNWPWLALGVGAIVVAGPIAGGIFGGRRR